MYPGTVTRVIMKFDVSQIVHRHRGQRHPDAAQPDGPAATSTCGTATSWSTKSTT